MKIRTPSKVSYNDIIALDEILSKLNLRRHSVLNDGNCFYRAISHQLSLLGRFLSPKIIRRKSVSYLEANSHIDNVPWIHAVGSGETEEEYLRRHSKDGELADDIMIQAAASSLGYAITIITALEKVRIEPHTILVGDVTLARINGSNYISLEGEESTDLGHLPRIFSLRDLTSSRGIVKQTASSNLPRAANCFLPIYENENDKARIKNKMLTTGPGLNPIDDEYDNLLYGGEELEEDLPPYDQFICEPPEDDSRTTSNTIKFFQKAFKCISYFVFGGAVFGGAFVSKASLMVLMNSAKPYNETQDYPLDLLDHDIIRAWSYIIILSMLLFPEVLTMTYSFYRIVMKPESRVDISTLLLGALLEFLHAIGESLLFLRVLPHLDATYALLFLPLVGFIPICIHIHAKILSVTHNKKRHTQRSLQYKRIKNLVMAVAALILQIGGIITIFAHFFGGPMYDWFQFFSDNNTFIWAFIGILLTSLRHWENFVSSNWNFSKKFSIKVKDLQNKLDGSRFQTSFIYSLIKCSVLVGMTFIIFMIMENDSYVSDHVTISKENTEERFHRIFTLLSHNSKSKTREQILQQLWYVFAVQSCCSFIAFFFGRVACMTMAQRESFTLPTFLVTPAISACSAALWAYKVNKVASSGTISYLLDFVGLGNYGIRGLKYYIDWNNIMVITIQNEEFTTSIYNPTLVAAVTVIIGLFLGSLGIFSITHYLWHNPENRLERMEVLFVKPIYGGPMIDQILLLNRRQYEKEYAKNKQKKDEEAEKKRHIKEERKSSSGGRSLRRKSSRRATISKGHKFVPQLFLCATMWHETESEMTQILTSLMRLDRDQGSRRSNAPNDDDYYNFQVHVLFDDAMERTKDGKEIKTNKWVHQLCDLIPLAANKVELGKGYDLPPPVIYPTPYGGRLEFIMPHGNLLVVHLKDKEKIRHRKRWSQCMYMYYILGYLQATKKAYKLEDIFLLALDGDVDFQPNAVLLVLDRMKRNPDVGAACGRIHPTGSGPVVWFQKFEYAVGHWLQKTTEHVLGCVLCSPGCFSLFRGSALVDVNVMNQYTTKATEARHYVQWDQGEDRWLCTLLLKQGWRIEYSAASDSFTFAPEDFKEFYNQRRRWGPSTMANIFDILIDAKLAVKNNIYISWGYIVYQLGLMISSLLGPATVVMIVQGAFQYVFNWTGTVALIVSLTPVVIFIILCYTTSANTQVAVAGIMTIVYALVMMAVVVGVIGAMATNILLDPNNLFMILLVGLYAFTGLVHPQELSCLFHGMLYYLCVPSAFILLMVYSLTNMDNVSWGTREAKKPASETGNANQQALEQVAAKPTQGRRMQVGPGSVYDGPTSPDGYYSCGLGNLCQCALCITPQPVRYQPVPTAEVQQNQPQARRPTLHSRRPTLSNHANRQSTYKRFSTAKARQIAGLENKELLEHQIEQSLRKRMSLAQLRRISSRSGRENISTSKLRRMSTRYRRLSRKSTQNQFGEEPYNFMSESTQMLADELNEDAEFDHDLSDDDYDDEQVDPERLQDEEEEMLYWLIEGSLEDGVIEYLDNEERDFWKYLIEKYLYPLDEDKDEKARIKADLEDLRNRVTGAYFLLNGLWLFLNFALQMTITDIAIVFYIGPNRISVNPVSFAFLIFFLIILIVQFSCMLVHRWSTALHLLSVTSLKWKDKRDGIKNVSNKDLEKEQNRLKMKGKKNPGQNGTATANGIRDPLDPMEIGDSQFTPENNFTYKERSDCDGHDNPAYDVVNMERGGGYSSDEDIHNNVNTYESIKMKNRFDNNPANRLFGTINEKYGATLDVEDGEERKNSTAIDFEIFSDDPVSKKSASNNHKQEMSSDYQDKRSERPSTQESKHKPHNANVHFGPLPTHHEDDGDTSF